MASSSGHQPNFAALNRGHHVCLAGRPSRWALADILVDVRIICFMQYRRTTKRLRGMLMLSDITAVCILENFANHQSLIMADRVLKDLGRARAKERYQVSCIILKIFLSRCTAVSLSSSK